MAKSKKPQPDPQPGTQSVASKAERTARDALGRLSALTATTASQLEKVLEKAKKVSATKDKKVRKNPEKVAGKAHKAHADLADALAGAALAAERVAVATEDEVADGLQKKIETRAAADELDALTVVELRSRARAKGLTGYSRLSKAELVKLLSAADAG